MKAKTVFTILFLGIFFLKITAQITFEHSYPGPNSPSWTRLQLINMGTNEYKFAYVDFQLNQLNLYNINHTIYSTVTVPVPLINDGQNNIGYVTRSLFDCDTTKFEYAILPQSGNNTFYVYREDGTLLFKRDSTLAPYCFGCFGGSYDVRPIVNSPVGAKLFLMKNTPTGFMATDVYSLCGKVPDAIMEINNTSSFLKVYPNPSTGNVSFEFDLPGNTQNYKLVVFNSTGQEIKSEKITGSSKKYNLEQPNLAPGVYLFSLQSENKVLQNGKFIIIK